MNPITDVTDITDITVKQAYNQGRQILSKAGLDSPAFDALCLLSPVFGIHSRAELAIGGEQTVSPTEREAYETLIRRRLHEPLQYLLGQWEFDGMPLYVGKGVLVPREDTLALVEAAQEALEDVPSPRILDLCAGTGAVGLALARRIPDAKVTCVELSEDALPYLRRNIEAYGGGRVSCEVGNVLAQPRLSGTFHAIVSNPPYIPTSDIAGLQWEVRQEPAMALDGGTDGLDFYRAICARWTKLLLPGGTLAFEIGYDIREGVIAVMKQHGIGHIHERKDFSGISRCIFGTRVAKTPI